MTARYGWRQAVAVGAPLAVVAALFLLTRSPTAPARPDASLRDLFDPETLRSLLARPDTRSTTFVMTVVEFVGLAAMAFLPTLLVERFAFSSGRANVLFAAFFAVSALSQPLGGALSDRFGRDETLGVLAIAGALGYGALATGGSRLVALPAVVLTGAAMSATSVAQSRMIDGLADADRGTGFGLFRTVYLLVGATGTAVVGRVVATCDAGDACGGASSCASSSACACGASCRANP